MTMATVSPNPGMLAKAVQVKFPESPSSARRRVRSRVTTYNPSSFLYDMTSIPTSSLSMEVRVSSPRWKERKGAGNPVAVQVMVMFVCSLVLNCSAFVGEEMVGTSGGEGRGGEGRGGEGRGGEGRGGEGRGGGVRGGGGGSNVVVRYFMSKDIPYTDTEENELSMSPRLLLALQL